MKRLLLHLCCIASQVLHAQNRYDIVITEIMADPSPQVGLPNYEWVEIKNRGSSAVNLFNYKLGDQNGLSGGMPSFVLLPDSSLVICAGSALNALSSYTACISVTNFPSLDNNGETIFLLASNLTTLHALSYSQEWYGNELKKEGGWSLEMIDTRLPCGGRENWKASIHILGGSPGKKNSVDDTLQDLQTPAITRAYTLDSIRIMIQLNEPVDSLSATVLANYRLVNGPSIVQASCPAPLLNSVLIKTASPLQSDTIYSLSVSGLRDCKGNTMPAPFTIRVGMAGNVDEKDLCINEILCNPHASGYDFVELYNRSEKIIDLSKIFIANRNSSGQVISIKPVSVSPLLLFPKDYVVLTEDPANLSLQYFVKYPELVLPVVLPSYPDENGTVICLDATGTIIDEVNYNKDWHFKLISNDEGIALERIDPSGHSNAPGNWRSAASTAGYATPGYRNSQYMDLVPVSADFMLGKKIFSPDNDGRDDYATIHYRTAEPGYVANIMIYDKNGRPVRRLVSNQLLGREGYWNWDGLDQYGQALASGPYIVFAEIFNLEGKKKQFKEALILARPFE